MLEVSIILLPGGPRPCHRSPQGLDAARHRAAGGPQARTGGTGQLRSTLFRWMGVVHAWLGYATGQLLPEGPARRTPLASSRLARGERGLPAGAPLLTALRSPLTYRAPVFPCPHRSERDNLSTPHGGLLSALGEVAFPHSLERAHLWAVRIT